MRRLEFSLTVAYALRQVEARRCTRSPGPIYDLDNRPARPRRLRSSVPRADEANGWMRSPSWDDQFVSAEVVDAALKGESPGHRRSVEPLCRRRLHVVRPGPCRPLASATTAHRQDSSRRQAQRGGLGGSPLRHGFSESTLPLEKRDLSLSHQDIGSVVDLLALFYEALRRFSHRLRPESYFRRKHRAAVKMRADILS